MERSMAEGSYRQFCPVAMAAEVLCTRWTVVLLRELVAGSTRLNELRRGVPRMSPALLSQRSWWLIVDPKDDVDLCSVDPGFDVDLYVSVDLRTMTAIWMGLDTVRAAIANKRMVLTGDRRIASAMQTWLGLSPFAKEKKLA